MRLLLCSDIHCDLAAARRLVERSAEADVLVVAGDLGVMRTGLQKTVDVLASAACPAVLVAGNGESYEELSAACARWAGAHVLHGSGCTIEGVSFWGLGGAVPVTPFGPWSYDLPEEKAAELLAGCPPGAVLVTHSPPLGHVDLAGGRHLGSRAVVETIERVWPRLVVCGHIHGCWTEESLVGDTRIVNAGPGGVWAELEASRDDEPRR
ncbi:MAG: serine/threonine protein phosphatase [Gemmatimonadetes bacterium]|nr:serine/threonine protein phosphatase [Gemmatimonadota bacterium]